MYLSYNSLQTISQTQMKRSISEPLSISKPFLYQLPCEIITIIINLIDEVSFFILCRSSNKCRRFIQNNIDLYRPIFDALSVNGTLYYKKLELKCIWGKKGYYKRTVCDDINVWYSSKYRHLLTQGSFSSHIDALLFNRIAFTLRKLLYFECRFLDTCFSDMIRIGWANDIFDVPLKFETIVEDGCVRDKHTIGLFIVDYNIETMNVFDFRLTTAFNMKDDLDVAIKYGFHGIKCKSFICHSGQLYGYVMSICDKNLSYGARRSIHCGHMSRTLRYRNTFKHIEKNIVNPLVDELRKFEHCYIKTKL